MERFKVEHFEREHPGCPFPPFATFAPQEAQHLRAALARRAGLEDTTDGRTLLRHLLDISRPLENVNAADESFDLAGLTAVLGLAPQETVYINWNAFETIDRMRFADLARHFDDIWYPSVDDVEILDDTLSWVLFVRHHGTVALAQLEAAGEPPRQTATSRQMATSVGLRTREPSP